MCHAEFVLLGMWFRWYRKMCGFDSLLISWSFDIKSNGRWCVRECLCVYVCWFVVFRLFSMFGWFTFTFNLVITSNWLIYVCCCCAVAFFVSCYCSIFLEIYCVLAYKHMHIICKCSKLLNNKLCFCQFAIDPQMCK